MGLVSDDDGWRMPDWLWERIEPLLPAPPSHPLGCHRPRVPDRDAMDAILLVLRTGMQWNALERDRDLLLVARRIGAFRSGTRRGVPRDLAAGSARLRHGVGIDWAWLAADGAMGKAPLGGQGPARIPLIEQKGGETFASLRGGRGPDRAGARRRQPPRPEAPSPDARLDPDRARPTRRPSSRRVCAWTAATTPRGSTSSRRARLHAAHPQPRRRDPAEAAHPRLARPALGRRSLPLLAQPQPRPPDPLVEERRQPPRPAPTRLRTDRLQESPRRPTRSRPTGIGPKSARVTLVVEFD